MPRPTPVRQRGPNGRFLSSHRTVTAKEAQQAGILFTLPIEIRLAIYRFSFSSNNKCTLRRVEELTSQRHKTAPRNVKIFSNSILTTCNTIYAEALPLFYASQTFHYAAELDCVFHQPTIKQEYLQWVKHISIDATLTLQSFDKLEPLVTTHIHSILTHCTKLTSFTLHVIPAAETSTDPFFSLEMIPKTLGNHAAAKALRKLRPRLDTLSIVTLGNWHSLHHFHEAVASDEQWVEGEKCYEWPGLSLTAAQYRAVHVKQRRYTLAGREDVVHPHKLCVRAFHIYRSEKRERKG